MGTWVYATFVGSHPTRVNMEAIYRSLVEDGVAFNSKFRRGLVGESGYSWNSVSGGAVFSGGSGDSVYFTIGCPHRCYATLTGAARDAVGKALSRALIASGFAYAILADESIGDVSDTFIFSE